MKFETTILLLTLAIVSCTPAERPPTQEEKASTETEVETLRALEESVVAAFRAGEISAWTSSLLPSTRSSWPATGRSPEEGSAGS